MTSSMSSRKCRRPFSPGGTGMSTCREKDFEMLILVYVGNRWIPGSVLAEESNVVRHRIMRLLVL